MRWWLATQPKWRDTTEWPLAQEEATTRNWGDLAEGGKDGLFLAVVSLGWWVLAQDTSEDSKVDEAIKDITWVIKNLVSSLTTSTTSSSAATSPLPRGKRPRLVTATPQTTRSKRVRA